LYHAWQWFSELLDCTIFVHLCLFIKFFINFLSWSDTVLEKSGAVPGCHRSSARQIVLFTDSPIPIVFTSKFSDTDADTDKFTVTRQTSQ